MAAKMTVFQRQLTGGLRTPDSSTRSIVSPVVSQADSPFRGESVKLEYEQDLDFSLPPPHSTLDPNALLSSPSEASIDDPTATTLDLTQHPAEVLCDQQCQSRVTRLQWGQTMELSDEQSRHMAFLTLITTLTQLLFLTMSSTVFSLLHRPLHQIFFSLRMGNPLPVASTTTEAYSIFRLILWLISTPLNHQSATTTLSSNNTRENQRATFRIRLLERLLACSPALARPLKDATASALQLVSDSTAKSRNGCAEADSLACGREMASLMTMLWAIESIEDPQRKCSSDILSKRRGDPAGDIRRLCLALDGLFNGDASGAKASRTHDEWNGGQGAESPSPRRLESLDFTFSALSGKYGTGL
jgi:transcriptional activator HAC1